jgi:hypothetical protein
LQGYLALTAPELRSSYVAVADERLMRQLAFLLVLARP